MQVEHKTEQGTVLFVKVPDDANYWVNPYQKDYLHIGNIHGEAEYKQRYVIGIDSGVNTGFSIWDRQEQKLIECYSVMIHQAFELILKYRPQCFVRVEDARLRKYITGGREKLQGAGSIKRDAKIWEDFLSDKNIPFEMVAPKDNRTKLDDVKFKRITGFKGRTNQHARDAAMLVYGFNKKI